MKIWLNDIETEVDGNKTLLEICRNRGISIPSLCYAPGAAHQPSCMVCMVQNEATGDMLPSCSTYPVEGMRIATSSEEVLELRKMALELLLSDHRADCDAPCATVCPEGLNIEGVLYYFDRKDYRRARGLMAAAFGDSEPLPCAGCKALCEKVCRRGMVDAHVEIRSILAALAAMEIPDIQADASLKEPFAKGRFSSKVGRFSEQEKLRLKAEEPTPSNCLHCACGARKDCRLRDLATEAGIKAPDYGVASAQPFKVRQQVTEHLWFEPAKCVRCGLCVYNTRDGFTFKGRGFSMQVVLPEESRGNVDDSIAKLCPTGALSIFE